MFRRIGQPIDGRVEKVVLRLFFNENRTNSIALMLALKRRGARMLKRVDGGFLTRLERVVSSF